MGKGKGNVSPSAEQKNGVCESCERGEIAFSFHFTRLPFLVQPSSFTSRPLLRTRSHKQTRHTCTHTHTRKAPRPQLWSALFPCLGPRAPPSDTSWSLQRRQRANTLIWRRRGYLSRDTCVSACRGLDPGTRARINR